MRKIIITFISCFLSICLYAQPSATADRNAQTSASANRNAETRSSVNLSAQTRSAANRSAQATPQVNFSPKTGAPAIIVEKSGKGDPVLFLPGFMSPGSVWSATVKNLAVQKQSLLVSYAGFNGLAPIDTPWYPELLRELSVYISDNKLHNLTLVGHSMGGNLAVDLAAAMPEIVTKLILVDAIPCQRELMMPGVSAAKIQYISPYNNQLLAMNDSAFLKMVKSMNAGMTNSKQGLDSLMRWAMAADRKTFVYGYTDLLKLDLRDTLKLIKAETLILGASFPSAEMVQQTFSKQYANLTRKTIEIAANSKHFIMFDQPEWLYGQINNFLSK